MTNTSTNLLFDSGKEKYIINIIYDVTDKVLLKAQSEKQQQQLETILNNISDKVAIVDLKGQYIYQNKTTIDSVREKISKYGIKSSKEAYLKTTFYSLSGIKIPEKLLPAHRVLRGEEFYNYTILGVSDNLTEYYKVIGIPLYDKNNKLYAGVLMYKDITDKMVLEEYNSFKEQADDFF